MKTVSRLVSGDGVRVAYPLFYQVEGGGSKPTEMLALDYEALLKRVESERSNDETVLPG
jgi:hypothetical protein